MKVYRIAFDITAENIQDAMQRGSELLNQIAPDMTMTGCEEILFPEPGLQEVVEKS